MLLCLLKAIFATLILVLANILTWTFTAEFTLLT